MSIEVYRELLKATGTKTFGKTDEGKRRGLIHALANLAEDKVDDLSEETKKRCDDALILSSYNFVAPDFRATDAEWDTALAAIPEGTPLITQDGVEKAVSLMVDVVMGSLMLCQPATDLIVEDSRVLRVVGHQTGPCAEHHLCQAAYDRYQEATAPYNTALDEDREPTEAEETSRLVPTLYAVEARLLLGYPVFRLNMWRGGDTDDGKVLKVWELMPFDIHIAEEVAANLTEWIEAQTVQETEVE